MLNKVILGVIAGARIAPSPPDLSNILFYGTSSGYGWLDLPSFSARAALSPAPAGGVRKGSFTSEILSLPTTNAPYSSNYSIPGYAGLSTPAGVIGALNSSRATGDGDTLVTTAVGAPYAALYSLPSLAPITFGGVAPPGACNDGAISPDGQYLALASSSGTRLVIYRLSDWSVVTIAGTYPPNVANAVDWSPNSRYLAVAGTNSPYLHVYDALSGFSNVTLGSTIPGAGRDVNFSRDGSWLAVGHNNSPFMARFSTSTWVKASNPATLPAFTVFGIAYSKNDEYLACGGDAAGANSRIIVYNAGDMSVASQPGPTSATIVQRLFFN